MGGHFAGSHFPGAFKYTSGAQKTLVILDWGAFWPLLGRPMRTKCIQDRFIIDQGKLGFTWVIFFTAISVIFIIIIAIIIVIIAIVELLAMSNCLQCRATCNVELLAMSNCLQCRTTCNVELLAMSACNVELLAMSNYLQCRTVCQAKQLCDCMYKAIAYHNGNSVPQRQ